MSFRLLLWVTYFLGFLGGLLGAFALGIGLTPQAHSATPFPEYYPPLVSNSRQARKVARKDLSVCRPAFEGNEPIGIRCSYLTESNPLFQFGLNDGDLIVEYNGLKIDDPTDIARMELWIQNRTPEHILVRRGNRLVAFGTPAL